MFLIFFTFFKKYQITNYQLPKLKYSILIMSCCNNVNTTRGSRHPNATEDVQINILTPRKKEKTSSASSCKNNQVKDKCAICIDNLSNQFSSTACGHKFCLTCLHDHLKLSHTCPLCRAPILEKPPKKPLNEIDRETAVTMIKDEIEMWDIDNLIKLIKYFPEKKNERIENSLQEFGFGLAERFIQYQHDDDVDFEYDDDDDEMSISNDSFS